MPNLIPGPGRYYGFITAAIILFAALAAPEALCPDKRSRFLGVYLSSPLNRSTYLLAKAIAVVGVLLLVTLGPPLLLLVGLALQNDGPRGFGGFMGTLGQILAAGVSLSLMFGALSLAIPSLTDRRAFASAGSLLLILGSTAITNVIVFGLGGPKNVLALSLGRLPFELALRIFTLTGLSTTATERAVRSTEYAAVHGSRGGGERRRDPGRRGRDVVARRRHRGDQVTVVTGPTIEVRQLSKWFGSVVALSDVTLRHRPGRDRAARPERRRQVDAVPGAVRAGQPVAGDGADLRRGPPGEPRPDPPDRHRPPAGAALRAPDDRRVRRPGRHLAPSARSRRGRRSVPSRRSSSIPATPGRCRPTPRACASGSSWPRRSSTTRTSSSSTSRSKGSIPASGCGRSSCSAASATQGKTVIVSSHVLDEVERFGSRILVIAQGRLVAEGPFSAIRDLMDDRPHHLRVGTDRPPTLAAGLLAERRGHQRPGQRRLDRGRDQRRRRLPALDRGGGPGLRRPADRGASPRRRPRERLRLSGRTDDDRDRPRSVDRRRPSGGCWSARSPPGSGSSGLGLLGVGAIVLGPVRAPVHPANRPEAAWSLVDAYGLSLLIPVVASCSRRRRSVTWPRTARSSTCGCGPFPAGSWRWPPSRRR